MLSGYTNIDPQDREAVLWLQLALAQLLGGPWSITQVGTLGPLTEKAIMYYQQTRKLPITRQPDEVTLARICQELKERDIAL